MSGIVGRWPPDYNAVFELNTGSFLEIRSQLGKNASSRTCVRSCSKVAIGTFQACFGVTDNGKSKMTSFPTMLMAAASIAVLVLPGCRREEPASEESVRVVRAMKVADFSGLAQRSFPGRARATREVDLAFRVSGPLVARPIKVGDEVEEGDLIARIDPRDFHVALRNAEGNLQRARANEERAQSDYERALKVQKLNPGAITQADIDKEKESVDVAKADISALEASVDSAKDALSDTDLLAPYAGTIVATYVENFQNVREMQMIARLLDKSRVEFEVNIPETLISMVPLKGPPYVAKEFSAISS